MRILLSTALALSISASVGFAVARGDAREAPPAAALQSGRTSQVVVYSASWCGWCRKTLAWLDRQGIAYDNRDIERDARNREELVRKTGRSTIPVVEIDGRLVRGYDPARMRALLDPS